jgi:hypothetical protein
MWGRFVHRTAARSCIPLRYASLLVVNEALASRRLAVRQVVVHGLRRPGTLQRSCVLRNINERGLRPRRVSCIRRAHAIKVCCMNLSKGGNSNIGTPGSSQASCAAATINVAAAR